MVFLLQFSQVCIEVAQTLIFGLSYAPQCQASLYISGHFKGLIQVCLRFPAPAFAFDKVQDPVHHLDGTVRAVSRLGPGSQGQGKGSASI